MPKETDYGLFDDLPSQKKKKVNPKTGKRIYRPRLEPELPPGTPLPETPPPPPISPEQTEIDNYLDKLSREFFEGSKGGKPLIDLLKRIARDQGEVTLSREELNTGNFLEIDTFIAESASFQRRLIKLVLGLPYREQSHAQFAQKLSSILKANLGNELTLATQLTSGCLATVTLIDSLDLLDEAGQRYSSIVIDTSHDQLFATDLEIMLGGHLYLFQIKTRPSVDNPIQILDDDDQKFDWEKRMLYLKKILAKTLHLPEQHIHRILATVPPMWAEDIEAYTGFLKPEVKSKYRQAYLIPLTKIGFKSPSPDTPALR